MNNNYPNYGQQPNNQPNFGNQQQKKENGNSIVIIILILVVIIGGVGGYFEYQRYKNKNKKEEPVVVEKKKEDDNKNNIILTDEIKLNVFNKMKLLLGVSDDKITNNKNTFKDNRLFMLLGEKNYLYKIVYGETNEELNIYILLHGSTESTTKLNYKTDKFNDVNINFDEYEVDNTFITIDGATIANKYQQLYGKKLTKFIDPGSDFECPSFYYDITAKKYIKMAGCADNKAIGEMVYLDSFETNETSVIVNTYMGGIIEIGNNKYTYNYVIDYDIRDVSIDLSMHKGVTFKEITDKNKNSFTKYKFIFTKASDNNFYFTKIERAS